MALIHNTNSIVTSGLVLALDAANPKSYSGSGATTWSDLSGNGNTGTLTNGPTYNDGYGGTRLTGTRTDANASSLVLAIPMDGANNGITFTDESANIRGSGSAKSITRNGDTKTLTAQSKFYGSSGFFDGSGDYLTIPFDTSLTFGSDDFTIEHWINPQRVSGQDSIICGIWDGAYSSPQSWICYLNTNGTYGFAIDVGSVDTIIFTSPSVISNNVWAHIAITRSGTTWRLFINGILDQTTTNGSSISAGSAVFAIGAYQNMVASDKTYTGYFQDLRIYKGVAKYTANFIPFGNPNTTPTGAFPIYNTKDTGGSLVFNGSNQYISIGSQSLVGSGTSPFSVELWFYNTKNWTSGQHTMFVRVKQDSEFFIALYNPSGTLNVIPTFRGFNQWGIPVTQSDYVNKWVCLSVVYNGGDKNTAASFLTYVNGVQLASGTTNFGAAGGAGSNCNILGADGDSGCNAVITFHQGNIGAYKVYNRALTAAEVSQNYKALKSRYGLT